MPRKPPTSSPAGSRSSPPPVSRFRLRVTRGEAIAVGPGKVALLEAVERTGSITAAAKDLGMSYRRAWLLVDEVNHALREPAVESTKGGEGGGVSRLTPTGRRMVELYRGIERTAASACKADMARLVALLARD